ncbi:MAG: zinc ribbon domain-containing protein [Clostridiales bacterium]|nr:zinc ribbon domain-containing protein [Clostridiales bacterium]
MNYCSNCGEPLEEGSLFCSVCGAKAEGAETAVEPAPDPAETAPAAEKPAKKKRKLWWLLIPAAVLLLAFGALLAINLTGAYVKLLPPSRTKFAIVTKAALNDALDRAFAKKDVTVPDSVKANIEASVKIDMKEQSDSDYGYTSGLIINLINQLTVKADIDMDKTGARLRLDAATGGMEIIEAYLKAEDGKLFFAVPDHLDSLYSIDTAFLAEEFLSSDLPDGVDAAELSNVDLSPLDEEKTRAEIMEIYEILMKVLDDEDTVLEIASEKQELRLKCADFTVTGDVYVITPSEKALENLFIALAEHFGSEDSYLGGRIKALNNGEDVFGEMKEKAAETAKELHDKHLTVRLGLTDKEVPFMSVNTDDFAVYTDRLIKAGGSGSRYIEAAPKGKDDPALVKLCYTVDNGSAKKLSGFISIKDDDENSVFDMELEGKELTLTFDLDLSSRSAIGTFAGGLSLKLGEDELATLTVKPEGERMMHVLKLLPVNPETEIELITLTFYVKEGEAVTLPTLPEEKIESMDQFDDVLDELVNSLLGTLMQLFLGGGFDF